MDKLFTLNLESFISKNESALVGRDDAYKLRSLLKERNFDLVDLEKRAEIIEVVVPESILTINRSYFLGAFADRVRDLGKELFLKKYKFKADDYINSRVVEYIDSALLDASSSAILNAR